MTSLTILEWIPWRTQCMHTVTLYSTPCSSEWESHQTHGN